MYCNIWALGVCVCICTCMGFCRPSRKKQLLQQGIDTFCNEIWHYLVEKNLKVNELPARYPTRKHVNSLKGESVLCNGLSRHSNPSELHYHRRFLVLQFQVFINRLLHCCNTYVKLGRPVTEFINLGLVTWVGGRGLLPNIQVGVDIRVVAEQIESRFRLN